MNSESPSSSSSSNTPSPKRGYINNVDELIHQTPLSLVLQHYGLPLPENSTGEYRMKCVFNETCSDSQYGNLTVRQDVAKQIYCHTCNTRGNLLVLIHGLEAHRPPDGGRLRGQEFKNAVNKLREINGEVTASSGQRPYKTRQEMQQERRAYESTPLPPITHSGSGRPPDRSNTELPANKPAVSGSTVKHVNTPLFRHDNEAARAIADLAKDLIVDVSQMSPEAAQYVRKRPWMTPELLRKWGAGWIPGNGRSMFRKNYFVYTHRNERGEVVSYSGRDLNFEPKWNDWIKAGKPEGKKPSKHRYVSGYHRGIELYGGHATRLQDPWVTESLNRYGLVIVEGMNEVLRMECLQVAAVGLGSNKVTTEQREKLTRFSQQAGNNRALLLPDCDEEGEAGFKDLLWKLAEDGVHVQIGCSRTMLNGQFEGRQPEDFTEEQWNQIQARILRTWPDCK